VLEVSALRVERSLCGCDEQSEHQRGDRRDQANPKSHDVLGVLVEMMLWQRAAKLRAQKDAAQAQYEYDG
jgi:hypothetical protein